MKYLVQIVKFTFASQVDMEVLVDGSYMSLNDFVAKNSCMLLTVAKTNEGGIRRHVAIFLQKVANEA